LIPGMVSPPAPPSSWALYSPFTRGQKDSPGMVHRPLSVSINFLPPTLCLPKWHIEAIKCYALSLSA